MLLIKKKQKNKDLSTTLCGKRVYSSEIYLRVALRIIFLIKYFISYTLLLVFLHLTMD